MKRAIAIACVGLCAGCSLIWVPDRDAIIDDLDAGDAGPRDGGPDAGPDGGPDACPGGQILETSCSGGVDDDCDGAADCFDFDCRGVAACCTGAPVDNVCVDSVDWTEFPRPGDMTIPSCTSITAFSTHLSGPPRALISNECQPIHFGMRYVLDFDISALCAEPTGCDWAALTFVNQRVLIDGSEIDDEFRIVVFSDGSARVERAGTTIESLPLGTFMPPESIRLVLEVEPGPDAAGNDVLFATVTLTQGTGADSERQLMDHEQLMPVEDVNCFGGASPEVGLFVALEGKGTDVQIASDVEITERSCANPSQFRSHENASTAVLDDCSPLNTGAPSLVNYCYSNCDGSPQIQWDAWVDGSMDAREFDMWSRIDFGVCAYSSSGAQFPNLVSPVWNTRPALANGYQWLDTTSSREPSVLPIIDRGATTNDVQALRFAYAARFNGATDAHEIRINEVTRTGQAMPTATTTLSPSDVADCRSLRDPLLIADWMLGALPDEESTQGAWLLFTCEPMDPDGTNSIMRVHLNPSDYAWDEVPAEIVLQATEEIGSYAFRGVRSPEGFSEVSGEQLTVRLWYIARDNSGEPRLAYAQGRGDLGEFPELQVYPANPVLGGADLVLGGDCTEGCTLTGASVASMFADRGNYEFLIARSRRTAAGEEHDLIPLLQPRPND